MSRYIPTYFSAGEFLTCSPACKIEDMDVEFLRILDNVRAFYGRPITLTCAYRSRDYDKSKGRDGSSYHCKGRAVDVYCRDPYHRAELVYAAQACGLNGIGIGKNFIHLDNRVVRTMWHYYE